MRLKTILRLFVMLLLIFITQKVLFMLYNLGMSDGAPFGECLAVLWHGLRLDIATACYLVILPTLVVLVSWFFKHFPLRRVLMPYYVLIAVVLALIFVSDTVLYGFWGAKLDANDLKLFTAIIVALFLAVPYLQEKARSPFTHRIRKGD